MPRSISRPPRDSGPLRIAYVAYSFPPRGGGGTPRNVKFVKYLPRFGCTPVVFTGRPSGAGDSREFINDETGLLDLTTDSPEIVRIDQSDHGMVGILKKLPFQGLAWAVAYPLMWDDKRSWALRAIDTILQHHAERPFDVVFVSAAPFVLVELGYRVSRATGLPLVVDMRDLWTLESHCRFPSRLHYLWMNTKEKKWLSKADAIIANTPGAARVFRRMLQGTQVRAITVIPNGFDPEERESDARAGGVGPSEKITFLHAGTVYEGGETVRKAGHYYPLPLRNEARSLVPTAKAIALLRQTNPRIADRVSIRLVGYVPPSQREVVENLGVASWFTFDGVVSRMESISAMSEADALMVLQFAFAEATRPVPYVPGKVYEYLPLGKPILAPIPPGDLADMLRSVPQAYVCDYRDPSAIAGTIESIVNDIDSRRVRFSRDAIEKYSRVGHAETLAGIFREVVSARANKP